jgi:hypothetical protein
MDTFLLPDGSNFDCEIGLGRISDLPPCTVSKESIREAVDERLAVYGLEADSACSFRHISAEVGDDELGVFRSPTAAALQIVTYQLMGMVVSEEDTSINPRFGNFAEDLFILPDGYEQTYHYCRKTSDFRNMAFLDVPKLRLAIDIRPGRMNHSSTNDGKASLLGSRLAWLPRESPVRTLWEVFSLYQDVNLGLIRDDKFAYLPTALGGYGKPIPFGLEENFERFCASYKQGTHAKLYRELVRRANSVFDRYKIGGTVPEDPVLSAVARLQSGGFHDWIKAGMAYGPACWVDAPPEVKPFRVAKHGVDTVLDSALRRLQAERYLVTEGELEIANEHNQLCKWLTSCETHKDFLERRKASKMDWKNMSINSLWLYGYIKPYRLDPSLQVPLRSHEYDRFWLNITSRRIHLRTLLRQEYFYDVKAKDIIYQNGPMAVRSLSIMPRITQMGERAWFTNEADVGGTISDEKGLRDLLEWVKKPIGPMPIEGRTLIEDDPVILNECRNLDPTVGVCIVTDDRRLCKDVFMQTKNWVCQVPTRLMWAMIGSEEANPNGSVEPWVDIVSAKYPMYNWVSILDTGSIEAFEEAGMDTSTDGPTVRKLFLLKPSHTGWERRRQPPESTGRVLLSSALLTEFPDAYIYRPSFLNVRKKHPLGRGWA